MNKTLLMSALLLALGAGGGYLAAKQTTTDRKSTRLNSSH